MGVAMKHILRVASIALAFLCAADFAMAFTPGVPPLSGPGSVFYGNDEAAPKQKSHPKQKLKSSVLAPAKARQNEVLPLP
jgi:hypothetical protein